MNSELREVLGQLREMLEDEIALGTSFVATDEKSYDYFRAIAADWKKGGAPSIQKKSDAIIKPPINKVAPLPKIAVKLPQKEEIAIEEKFERVASRPERKELGCAMIVDEGKMLKFLKELFPERKWLDGVPSDEEAVRVSNRWKLSKMATPIAFISDDHIPDFYEKVRMGVGEKIAPAVWVSLKEALKSDQFHLFVMSRKFYDHHPAQFRGKKVILLAPAEKYEKDPELKRALWGEFCNWKGGR